MKKLKAEFEVNGKGYAVVDVEEMNKALAGEETDQVIRHTAAEWGQVLLERIEEGKDGSSNVLKVLEEMVKEEQGA